MKHKFKTYQDFLVESGLDQLKVPTLDEFKQKFTLNGKNYCQYTINNKDKYEETDLRRNIDEYMSVMYHFLYDNDQELIKLWWYKHCYYDDDLPRFLFTKDIQSKHGDTIDGTYNNSSGAGRVVKNLCWQGIFENVSKPNTDAESVLRFIKGIYLDHRIVGKNIFTNMTTRFMQKKDYDGFFAILRGVCSKNSVFNPYTYSYILRRFTKGKNLLCPVMSWCVPVMAFHNTDYEHLVGIDVMDITIDLSKYLHELYMKEKSVFDETPKKFEIYKCPSEKIDERYGFKEKYKDHFDTVFFSPPYFDLEMYEGGEQSYLSFTTYEEWLKGYWEKTVELCYDTLKDGGTFAFVIVPEYGRYGKTVEISKDMKEIASKYFTFKQTKRLSWGGFKKSSGEKRKEVVEHIHFFEKVKKEND